MKSRIAVAAAALLSGLALPAPAADPGWYGGLSLGRATNRFNAGDFASGIAGVAESQTRRDDAARFFAGYNFNRNFGIEGGYADLGRFSYNFAGATGASSRYGVRAWSLAGVGSIPFGRGFSVHGKLGLALTRASDSIDDPGNLLAGTRTPALLGGGSRNHTSLLWGAGAEYAFNRKYSLHAEYEDYGRVGDSNTTGSARDDVLSLGLKVKF